VGSMFLFAAAVMASAPPQPPVSASVQATAMIRIVSGVALKLDGSPNPDAPPAREIVLKAADGAVQMVKLIEFQ
jgi:hypothetical protein